MMGTEMGADGPGDDAIADFDDGRWGSDADDLIDIVAEPVRYPRSPLIWLIVIGILPALGLFALHRWSDREADDYEASRGAVDLLETSLEGRVGLEPVSTDAADSDNIDEDPVVAVELSTSLFDFRRAPGVVALVAGASRLATEVDPVLSFIGPASCAAVAIDGIAVTSSNPDLPVVPASAQKLLVATAALDVLGPDFTFSTSVAVPPAVDGVVDGDIFLIGGGDPLLTSTDFSLDNDRLPVFGATPFDVLADALVDAGITRIRGVVIGDGSRYDDEFVVDEWAPGVAFNDAGPYDALMANDSRVRGRSGRQDDPSAGAAREFVRLLNDRGIRVDGGFGSGVASNLVDVLATVESVPLTEVVTEMLITSDNNTAEMLLKEIGVATGGAGTRAAGLQGMADSLDGLGVDTSDLVMRDGSGLSNENRVTCGAMLKVIQLSVGGPIDQSLPIAGFSGTLGGEFVGTPMALRLRAKTGTLNNEPFDEEPGAVKSLAGFVDPVPGSGAGTIEFVLILNTPNASEDDVYQQLWNALGDRLATYPAETAADTLGPR